MAAIQYIESLCLGPPVLFGNADRREKESEYRTGGPPGPDLF